MTPTAPEFDPATAEATANVRAWFREQVLLSLQPVKVGAKGSKPPVVSRKVAAAPMPPTPKPAPVPKPQVKLKPRHTQRIAITAEDIVARKAAGETDAQIAASLTCSIDTIWKRLREARPNLPRFCRHCESSIDTLPTQARYCAPCAAEKRVLQLRAYKGEDTAREALAEFDRRTA